MWSNLEYLRTRQVGKNVLDSVIAKFTASKEDVTVLHGWQGSVPPMSCKFDNSGKFLAVSDEEGSVVLLNSAGSLKPRLWDAHENAVFDLAWSSGSSRLVTASGDQTCALWDVNGQKNIGSFRGHTKSVKTVDFKETDDNIFVSGSRDGQIILWDVRRKGCTKITQDHGNRSVTTYGIIKNAHSYPKKSQKVTPSRRRKKVDYRDVSVTCVLFQDDHTIVSAGSEGGAIKVWDLRRTYRTSVDHPMSLHSIAYCGNNGPSTSGYSHLLFDRARLILYASSTDSVIYKYNFSSYNPKPIGKYYGHLNQNFYVKSALSPNDQYLLSGSGDNSCYIWNTDDSGHAKWKLNGHFGEVPAVSWSKEDFGTIATASDDSRVCIWRISNHEVPNNDLFGRTEKINVSEGNSLKQVTRSFSTPSKPSPCTNTVTVYYSINSVTPVLSNSVPSQFATPPSHTNHKNTTPKSGNQSACTKLCSFTASNSAASTSNKNHLEGIDKTFSNFSTPQSIQGVLSPSKDQNILSYSSLRSHSARRNLDMCRESKKINFDSTTRENVPDYSPTGNLPNLIVQGTLSKVNVINNTRPSLTLDWLTRHGKQAKRRKLELPEKPSPKLQKSRTSPSNCQSKQIDKFFCRK